MDAQRKAHDAGGAARLQRRDLEFRVKRVAFVNRFQEPARLFEKADQRLAHLVGKGACADRALDQRHEAMCVKARMAQPFQIGAVVMDGMIVAAGGLKRGEETAGHGARRRAEHLAQAERGEGARRVGDMGGGIEAQGPRRPSRAAMVKGQKSAPLHRARGLTRTLCAWVVSSVGRAFRLHRKRRRFESV